MMTAAALLTAFGSGMPSDAGGPCLPFRRALEADSPRNDVATG
jgi:hypothetical protein